MSTPYILPQPRPFRPRYVQPDELQFYGLPSESVQPMILGLVDAASSYIDEYCGRTDGNGQGSLVFCTYQERILMQAAGRNIFRVSFKPMAVIPVIVQTQLIASAAMIQSKNPLMAVNWYYTGFQANTVVKPDTSISAVISCSGRYGYPRRGTSPNYPDMNYMNPLMISGFFGGPPAWSPVDVSSIDFDTATGEIWIPTGLYPNQFTEVVITYNAGFNPMAVPNAIKHACVGLVKNWLARGGGTFGLNSISAAGTVNYSFNVADVDPTIQRFLLNYCNIIAY